MSLIYRGRLTAGSHTVTVEATATRDAQIITGFLSYGYRLYGSDYNLINTADTSCIAMGF